jgi:hypothetical protein
MTNDLIKVPSARRLMSSMRDLGYEFSDAVAEIVDNSIQAQANVIQVELKFDGLDSYLTISDNGIGMTPSEIKEAMRFGSTRDYTENDLGKFGLGLKTSSLSQCDLLTVSSRKSAQKGRIHSYSWNVPYISQVDEWEILAIDKNDLLEHVLSHLESTTGTVVTWEGLSRLTNYQIPTGGRAANEIKRLTEELRLSLGTIFHRYLTGEANARKVIIFINGEKVAPWDPFCRGEKLTKSVEHFSVDVSLNGKKAKIKFKPFILPHQKDFSSNSAHVRAGGLLKWNKQQGFYVYRSGRLLQNGGWCGLRTSDEHSKLARIMVDIPPGFDELFKVNISKMKINFPSEIKQEVIAQLAPILKLADETYRGYGSASFDEASVYHFELSHIVEVIEVSLNDLDGRWGLRPGDVKNVLPKLYESATPSERRALLRIFKRLSTKKINEERGELVAA